jgi:hypothetical protein
MTCFKAPHWRTYQCWYIHNTIYLTLKLVHGCVLAASVDTGYQYSYQEQASLDKATHIFIPSPAEQLKEVRNFLKEVGKLWPNVNN